VDHRFKALPLFVPSQTALAENDEARVQFNVQKADEVASVAGNHGKVVL
jgi:hypothetical protein